MTKNEKHTNSYAYKIRSALTSFGIIACYYGCKLRNSGEGAYSACDASWYTFKKYTILQHSYSSELKIPRELPPLQNSDVIQKSAG